MRRRRPEAVSAGEPPPTDGKGHPTGDAKATEAKKVPKRRSGGLWYLAGAAFVIVTGLGAVVGGWWHLLPVAWLYHSTTPPSDPSQAPPSPPTLSPIPTPSPAPPKVEEEWPYAPVGEPEPPATPDATHQKPNETAASPGSKEREPTALGGKGGAGKKAASKRIGGAPEYEGASSEPYLDKNGKLKKRVKVDVHDEATGQWLEQEMEVDWKKEYEEDKDRDTPEHQFLSGCVEGNIKLVKKLLKKNPPFTHITDENGKTGLFLACEKGHFDVVKLLADNGADPTLRTEHGNTPLHAAAMANSKRIAELLLAGGADPNAKSYYTGYTPLHKAVLRKNKHLVQLLIQHGADVNTEGGDGLTPYDIAEMEQVDHLRRLLKSHGGKPSGIAPHPDDLELMMEEEHDKAQGQHT